MRNLFITLVCLLFCSQGLALETHKQVTLRFKSKNVEYKIWINDILLDSGSSSGVLKAFSEEHPSFKDFTKYVKENNVPKDKAEEARKKSFPLKEGNTLTVEVLNSDANKKLPNSYFHLRVLSEKGGKSFRKYMETSPKNPELDKHADILNKKMSPQKEKFKFSF